MPEDAEDKALGDLMKDAILHMCESDKHDLTFEKLARLMVAGVDNETFMRLAGSDILETTESDDDDDDRVYDDEDEPEKNEFVCPECGSTEVGSKRSVFTIPDPNDVWSSILRRITCAKCDFVIPAHLGERWHGLSIEAAKQEWQDKYRETAWRSSDLDEDE